MVVVVISVVYAAAASPPATNDVRCRATEYTKRSRHGFLDRAAKHRLHRRPLWRDLCSNGIIILLYRRYFANGISEVRGGRDRGRPTSPDGRMCSSSCLGIYRSHGWSCMAQWLLSPINTSSSILRELCDGARSKRPEREKLKCTTFFVPYFFTRWSARSIVLLGNLNRFKSTIYFFKTLITPYLHFTTVHKNSVT